MKIAFDNVNLLGCAFNGRVKLTLSSCTDCFSSEDCSTQIQSSLKMVVSKKTNNLLEYFFVPFGNTVPFSR